MDQPTFVKIQPLKNLIHGLLKQTMSLQFFKGYVPQILLSPFLITLSQIIVGKSQSGI